MRLLPSSGCGIWAIESKPTIRQKKQAQQDDLKCFHKVIENEVNLKTGGESTLIFSIPFID